MPNAPKETGEDPSELNHQAGSASASPKQGQSQGQDQGQGRNQGQNQGQDAGADEPGEGNHAADRRYRASTEKFIADGKVDHAADEARRAIEDDGQRNALEEAERVGRAPAKEIDAEVKKRF